ncbi:MAG: hypothetical protein HYY30_01935 [Chloroflexi bacterium]|nr:hypothetical protein [Chloroflexota bacterium]
MYGWRGILGYVGPAAGAELVYEFYQMAPKGVLIRHSPGTIRQLDRENIERQTATIEEVATDLDESGVDAIMIGGAPLFTTQGVGSEAETCARIQQKVKARVSSTIMAVIDALRTMEARKLIFATPFEDWLGQNMKSFLEGYGFEVVNLGGLGVKRNADIAHLQDHAAYRLAKRLYFEADTKADTVFVHCPRWPTIDYIELLERELGCTVISSSQSTTWHALKLMNIRDDIPGYGALMRTLA